MVSPESWGALRNVTQNLQQQTLLMEKKGFWELVKPGAARKSSDFTRAGTKMGRKSTQPKTDVRDKNYRNRYRNHCRKR